MARQAKRVNHTGTGRGTALGCGRAVGLHGTVDQGAARGFFGALSAGRVTDLDAFFAPASRFNWYANSVRPGVRLNSSAQDRDSLLGYLQRRQAKHERIAVNSVDFNGSRGG
jgi:hypothetical protein